MEGRRPDALDHPEVARPSLLIMARTLFLSSLLIFLLIPQGSAVPEARALSHEVATYDQLLHAIRQTRASSQARIETAVEQEKVREVWETGKLIEEHILFHKERAEYGKQVLGRLSKDLGTSQTELSFMLQFARAYPIYSAPNKLSWAHYRELLSLNDSKEREEVTQQAVRERWSSDQVREEIRRRHASLSSPNAVIGDPLPPITPGPLYTYQIIKLKDRLKIDLGFGIYRDLSEKDAKKFKEGDIVQWNTASGTIVGAPFMAPEGARNPGAINRAPASDLFTYSALVTSVVDGDTFHALIDLGMGDTLAQRVRLRRIDAPEILSAEGKEAKALLEKILSRDNGRIVLQSRDIDQHGRPIADVWVCTARSVQASAVGTRTTGDECQGKSIDQEMLDQGLAIPAGD